jgi:hypothetical protein
MRNKSATEEQLSELHAELARQLKEAIQGEPVVVDDVVVGKKYNAAALREARQFLTDNNITATLDSKPLKNLVDALPSFEDDPAYESTRYPQ